MSALPLPDQFRLFAQGAARDKATTYDAICRGIADDPEILALIAEAPLAQRRPNLLLAAVHFLLLGGARHRLAAHYDTVRSLVDEDDRHHIATYDVSLADVADDFKDFCLEHRTELLDLITVRSTQTNEVGRCAALLPAFNVIASGYPEGQPLSLLDLGTSAGLNLLFDSYSYSYTQRADGTVLAAGRADSEVQLECTVRGSLDELPPLSLPAVATRTGIDATPIDPTTADGAHWLLACLWPDNVRRFARLRGALATTRTTSHRPVVHRGDIIDDLVEVASTIDPSRPLVVFHTWVAAYLTPARQRQLVETVRSLSMARPVHYVYAEAPVETPGLPSPPSPSPRPESHLVTALVHIAPDDAAPVRLADVHHHGSWVQWWATPTDPMAHRDGPEPALPHR